MGMRWAHILGDAFSASEFINTWGKIMANKIVSSQILTPPSSIKHQPSNSLPSLTAAKLLEPVGDNWLVPNNLRMETYTFHITEKHLNNVMFREGNMNKYKAKPFEMISAFVWKSMAKLKGTEIIAVCNNTKHDHTKDEVNEFPTNTYQVIGIVIGETTSSIANRDLLDIAKLIAEKFDDQASMIEKVMEDGKGVVDIVVYGAHLTFLNLEGVDVYGMQLKEQRPIFGSISIGGVGDEGTVVVATDANGGGRIVNMVMPEDELHHLKNELRVEWDVI